MVYHEAGAQRRERKGDYDTGRSQEPEYNATIHRCERRDDASGGGHLVS